MNKKNDKINKAAKPKVAKPKAAKIQQTPVDKHLLQLAREDPARLTAAQRSQLQRTLGNQALRQWVGNQYSVSSEQLSVSSKQLSVNSEQPNRQSSIVNRQSLIIQPKLTINAVGDKYEQEADALASEAMRKLHNVNSEHSTPIQRQELFEKDELQRKVTEAGTLSTSTNNLNNPSANLELPKTILYKGGAIPHVISSKIQSEKGKGQSIPSDFQEKIERILGYDFASIRIHNGRQAHYLSSMLAARAFTIGKDIFFNYGEYDPYSISGQELLLHELMHVLQQMFGSLIRIQREEDPDWLERANLINSGVAASTGAMTWASEAALRGYVSPGSSTIADFVSARSSPGLAEMALTGNMATRSGNMMRGLGKVSGTMGILGGIGEVISGYSRGSKEDMVHGGANALASVIGFMGLPGAAFSTGYSFGGLLDKGLGAVLGQEPSDMIGQYWYEQINGKFNRTSQRGLR